MNSGRHQATVTELVEAQVARTPAAPAVVAGHQVLSYGQLDRRANRLARHLHDLGVGPDVPVAVLAHRSIEMTVGLLAVLKAGGACLPIDPSVPPERVAYLLADSCAPVVLSEEPLLGHLRGQNATVVRLDRTAGGNGADVAPPPPPAPGQLAYIIYTSGSTGAPKGVMLTHRGLVNHHRAVAELYQLRPADRVLQFCSISFDVSVEEIFPTWSSGAAVVLRDDAVPILGRAWLEWLDRARVTMLNLPTAYWHEWARDLQALGAGLPERVRLVTVGGEKALGRAYRAWREVVGDGVRWVNAYGPTEATIMATWFEPDPRAAVEWDDPPIGRPLAATTALVLDQAGHPVAPGAAGELYLGGPGVARGYLNRAQLTLERFVPDPFSNEPGSRLYRTGDQVRLRDDGDLEFLGRLDQQVKVRGFRIELGEVETALLAHPAVADAAVVAREDVPGAKRLVAYVIAGDSAALTSQGLRRFLLERLPPYMVPTAFVVLADFPTTAHGKVDRRALPPPVRAGLGASAAPATPTEEVLAAIWAQVLGVEAFGVDEDFFDLGGHSLLAAQVIARVGEAFGVDLAMNAIFEAPTVRALAAVVGRREAGLSNAPALTAQPRGEGAVVALSLPQEQMWGLEAHASPPGLYNITALHRFSEPVDPATLHRAVDFLVRRHDSLRTSFGREGGRIVQTVAPAASVEVAVTDLTAEAGGLQEARLLHLIAGQDAEPFDVDRTPLWRCHLYRVADDHDVVAATFDHLISDGTSAFIFLSELADSYGALGRGEVPALPQLRVQYPDFALWQRRWLTEDRQRDQLDYWRRALAGMPQGPAVPFDRVPVTPTRRIASRRLAVPPPLYRGLNRLARAAHGTIFVVAVAAVDVVLHAFGHSTDIVLSTTLSGRQRAELDGVIGYFANIGRIRTDLSGDPTLAEIIGRARASVMGMFEHQDIPFMRVRQALFPAFPAGTGVHPLAVLPVELQYFHAGQDGWAPGLGVVERPGPDKGPDELFFRGQLHPLSISLLDDGGQLWGEINYKTDFYDEATIERVAWGLEWLVAAMAADAGGEGGPHPSSWRLSDLAAALLGALETASLVSAGRAGTAPGHEAVGTWRLEA